MADPFREFTLWLTALTGFLFAVIKGIQHLFGWIGVRGSREVASFESVLKAQETLLTDCRKERDEERVAARKREQDWREERNRMYQQLTEAHSRVFECEGILRRHGWSDPRELPRKTDREA